MDPDNMKMPESEGAPAVEGAEKPAVEGEGDMTETPAEEGAGEGEKPADEEVKPEVPAL